MNSSNLTTTPSPPRCVFLQNNSRLIESITFTAYYILMPLRFVIGITNQSIVLTALRKQASKSDASFAYHIFASAGKIAEICNFTTCVILKFHLAGMNGVGPGVGWYMTCYPLMTMAANVFIGTQSVVITLTLALATAMAVDRAFAMVKPFVYRNINKKRHETVALVTCIFLACATSADYVFRYTLVLNSVGYYSVVANPYYGQVAWTSVLNYSRTALRFVMTAALIISNGLNLRLYRKRISQWKQVRKSKNEEQKRQHEKTLLVLTCFQTPFVIFNMTILTCNSLGVFIKPTFSNCEGILVLALSDVGTEVTDMLDFYVMLAASKEFRRMILAVMPFKKAVSATRMTAS